MTTDYEQRRIVAHYELVDAKGGSFGTGGEIVFAFDALDAIDAALGGREPLDAAQRLDLASKLARPVFVFGFERRDPPPDEAREPAGPREPEPTERRGALVTAHGATARFAVPPPPVRLAPPKGD